MELKITCPVKCRFAAISPLAKLFNRVKNRKIYFLVILFFLLFFILSFPVLAQTNSTSGGVNFMPQVSIPGTKVQQGSFFVITGGSIGDYIIAAYKWCISAVAILAVVMIMVAGFKMITSRGNVSAITSAKSQITSALVGLVIIIFAYAFLSFINPNLVIFKDLTIKPVSHEIASTDIPLRLTQFSWYKPLDTATGAGEPGLYAQVGARKCGASTMIKTSSGQVQKVIGTECGEWTICELNLEVSQADILKWREEVVKDPKTADITTKYKVKEAACKLGVMGLGDTISLAKEDGTGLKGYFIGGPEVDINEFSCGQSADTFFAAAPLGPIGMIAASAFIPNQTGTRCSGQSRKGCTYVTVTLTGTETGTRYFSKNNCTPYPGKSCPLDEKRELCSVCGKLTSDGGPGLDISNCGDGFDLTKDICCFEPGTGWHVR